MIFLGLLIETVIDIREKRIWIPILLIELPILIGLKYLIGQGDIFLWIASIGVGSFFYIVSIVTKGQLGKGDALLFCMTGAGFGLWNNMMMIYITFFLAFLAALFLLIVKKVNRKYSMPLAPFVLASYILLVLGEQIS